MDALVVSRAAFAEADLAQARTADPAFGTGGLLELALAGGAYGPRMPSDTSVNFHTPQPAASFRRVAIGESVALFDGTYALALLRYALSLVEPGGSLVVLRSPAAARGVNGYLSMKNITAFFGEAAPSLPGSAQNFTAFLRRDVLPVAPASVLTSYLTHFAEMTRIRADLIRSRTLPADFRVQDLAAFVDTPLPVYDPDAFDPQVPSDELIQERLAQVGALDAAYLRQIATVDSYLVEGMRYKVPIMRHMMRACLRDPGKPLAIVDMGSGCGLLPMELALQDEPSIHRALAVDVGFSFLPTANLFYKANADRLHGIFKFALSSAEKFRYPCQFDVVTYVGSLLYVPKPLLREVLDRAFDAVKAGGFLAVHENMRSEKSACQLDFMFTADELDEHLGRYGTVRYFMSTAARELPREQVHDKTVFRLVSKPG